MSTLTEQEEFMQHVRMGRDIATSMIRTAVSTAQNTEQMAVQILELQLAAQHILATCAYNIERNNGKMGDDAIDDFCREMKLELALISSERQHIKAFGPKGVTGIIS